MGWPFGSPTRFGNVSAQLKQFLDSIGPRWFAGELTNKTATGFTSASNRHGGNESTLLALYNTMHHWGAIIVRPGYTLVSEAVPPVAMASCSARMLDAVMAALDAHD